MDQAAVNAPELDRPGLQWFNVDRPLSLADLRGKLVILDFWTFCCINCLHLIPTLRRVEQGFPESLVVIGVHSPKFAAEKDPANLAQAIARHGVAHPVIHDPEMELWRQYAVRAWPTLAFVSPAGKVLGQFSGEPDPKKLHELVARLLGEAEAAGTLAPAPLALSPAAPAGGRFRFPGKLKPLPGETTRWVLADSGHHQVALLDADGGELARFGAGQPGFEDGPAGEARFRDPQGLASDGQAVYVADTGNHAIRRIDLAASRVETLAGIGRRGAILGGPVPGAQAALASPWDLELDGRVLFFANAGSHQLGLLDLASGQVAALAGDGAEALGDGPAAEAHLAQPSALALDRAGATLYFLDSETSSLRALSLEGSRQVTTLIGTGLFDFGHVNGPFPEARLQHPLGLAWQDGRLLIADSYNNAVRIADPARQEIRDLDDGYLCEDALCLPNHEPAGIVGDGERVLLVDTNNHRIVALDPAARKTRTWAA